MVFRWFLALIRGFLGRVPQVTVTSNVLLLRIVTTKYGMVLVKAPSDENFRFLKKEALEMLVKSEKFPFAFITSEFDDDMLARFKLLRVSTRKEVDDNENLKVLKVKNLEEFFLMIKRPPVIHSLEEQNLAGPTMEQISAKTSSIKQTLDIPPAFRPEDLLLEDDMRKVFITLAEEAAYVIGAMPIADNLIAFYRQRILNYIKNHKNAEKVMVQLGFPSDRVRYAIQLKADNYKLALDWLIENETSSGYDEDYSPTLSPRTSYITSVRRDSILSTKYEPTNRTVDRINGLLEIVRFYADKDELVYEDSIVGLVVMGYEADVARDALRVTRNNIGAAIAHIHGDRNQSITELRHGLSASSHVREALLESSQVQLTFDKPQFFALYINILDNPSQANSWNVFSDIGDLMKHVIIKYSEEKCYIALNQFNESRLLISALSAPI